MLPIWVPEVTFGNAITLMVVVFSYLSLRARVSCNLDGIKKVDSSAILAATHAKMTFDNSAAAATNLQIAVADTKHEIANAVVSITAAAEANAVMHTPVATKLPAELRVTIAKELESPTAIAGN